ncbi:pyridoxal phosphate-dependent aminotransferase [Prauserella cavernicola]|uniref:Aminotransferase n=1 Tax=Prauserella cavernicola TaxID=2800127 RepID=A0A934V697_9PSEU|nr:pyridoxal phosphate-dependent aminotransferase [Prauserella cavernicola]MBK1785458.1 pyridoxal phosphate-dependent aminotransferase [Prauserella cavernicola]
MIKHSATLAINERLQAKRAAGEQVLHLGFGEAGLPVLPEVRDVLANAAHRNEYGSVVGSAEARQAAAGYFTRRGLPTDADDVVLAPGSKALLFGVLAVLPGDLVLPQPSWVSYAAQAALVGKRVLGVAVPEAAGGVPDPEVLDRELTRARKDGAEPGVLILTVPDNPTGTLADAALVKDVCAVAANHGLTVLSDEIYRDLVHDSTAVHSPATELPERTIVTAGLSKNMALGGYRIGFARVPRPDVRAALVGVASEVWSSLPAPMQEVATYVLGEPPEVRAHIDASRALHGAVARAVHAEFTAAGATCRPPRAGFYLYPDLEPLRSKGFRTSTQLAEHLLDHHGVGVLAGSEFGDDPGALRFRAATSLLYGADAEQRRTALRSADPVTLPWIQRSLTHLRDALAAVFDGK